MMPLARIVLWRGVMEIHRKRISRSTVLRRQFMAVQAVKAVLGAALSGGYIAFVGKPGALELIAMAGLVAPLMLTLLAAVKLPLTALEQASQFLFAALIGYLAVLTGGVRSPLLVWFVLVPAEAALAGGRPAVLRAAASAVLALLVVALLGALSLLPEPRLTLPAWQFYTVSVLIAVVQAAFVAAAAQDRQQAADEAAADGAAMYRFLADNAMDLITRHSSDGRIAYASPSALPLLGVAPESLIGLAPSALCHPDDLKAMQTAFMAAAGTSVWP